MAQEKKRRQAPQKRKGHDPALEAIRRAKQQNLAEHAAEMAERVEHAEQEIQQVARGDDQGQVGKAVAEDAVDPARGYVDAINGSDSDALAAADVQAEAGVPSAVDSPGASGTSGPSGAHDIEAAAEELGARPAGWVFPKLDIAPRKRSGVEEAQAFFEFSRRFSSVLDEGSDGADATDDAEHVEAGENGGNVGNVENVESLENVADASDDSAGNTGDTAQLESRLGD